MKCFQRFKEFDQILLMEKDPAPVEVGSFSKNLRRFFYIPGAFKRRINSILEEGTPHNTPLHLGGPPPTLPRWEGKQRLSSKRFGPFGCFYGAAGRWLHGSDLWRSLGTGNWWTEDWRVAFDTFLGSLWVTKITHIWNPLGISSCSAIWRIWAILVPLRWFDFLMLLWSIKKHLSCATGCNIKWWLHMRWTEQTVDMVHRSQTCCLDAMPWKNAQCHVWLFWCGEVYTWTRRRMRLNFPMSVQANRNCRVDLTEEIHRRHEAAGKKQQQKSCMSHKHDKAPYHTHRVKYVLFIIHYKKPELVGHITTTPLFIGVFSKQNPLWFRPFPYAKLTLTVLQAGMEQHGEAFATGEVNEPKARPRHDLMNVPSLPIASMGLVYFLTFYHNNQHQPTKCR